jgi:F0F1-type ATP synthase membrane subunit b/b'
MKLTPDYSLFVILAIFFLTYLVVRRFFLSPINRILVERESEHRTAEELYEAALARFREATAAVESRLQEARREGSRLRDRFRSDAAAHRAEVLQRTNGQADAIVGEADAHLKKDVAEARRQIVTESESLARLAAERILGRAV